MYEAETQQVVGLTGRRKSKQWLHFRQHLPKDNPAVFTGLPDLLQDAPSV